MQILCAYAAPSEVGSLTTELPEEEFLELGVGKVQSATTLTRRLYQRPDPDLLILFGVCGAYSSSALGVADLCDQDQPVALGQHLPL